MSNIDKLIEQLKEAKEELNKNINMSYSGSPNMADSGAMKAEGVRTRPEAEVGTRIGPAYSDKKDVGNGRMVVGDSPSPAAVNSKLMSNMAAKSDNDQPPAVDLHMKKPAFKQMKEKGDLGKNDEYFCLFKNGQWDIKKASVDPKLEPKDRKVKALQQQIDAGTYKPDPKKIADKMIKEEK